MNKKYIWVLNTDRLYPTDFYCESIESLFTLVLDIALKHFGITGMLNLEYRSISETELQWAYFDVYIFTATKHELH